MLGAVTAVPDAEFVYLCVPTPQGLDGAADLTYLQAAATEIRDHLKEGAVVVNKSTVPVGSTKVVERVLRAADVSVVSNPEFLREGTAVHDFLHPDRIVVGSDDQSAAIRVAALYLGVPAPYIVTDPATAELIKYAANAFLATKLSFINAIAALSEHVGADVADVVIGIGSDKRIGQEFLKPGPGWGGSCFPKDTKALVRIAEDAGYDFSLLEGVIDVNVEQHERVVDKIRTAAGGTRSRRPGRRLGPHLQGPHRRSPRLAVAGHHPATREEGAEVVVSTPRCTSRSTGSASRRTPTGVCDGAAVLAVLTDWEEFRWLDLTKVADLMATPSIVDARNLLDRNEVRRLGFEHVGIGR